MRQRLVHAVVANLTRQTMKLILIIEWSYLASLEMEISGHNESFVPETFYFKGGCGGSAVFSFLEVEKRPPKQRLTLHPTLFSTC